MPVAWPFTCGIPLVVYVLTLICEDSLSREAYDGLHWNQFLWDSYVSTLPTRQTVPSQMPGGSMEGDWVERLCKVSIFTKFAEEPFDYPYVMDTMEREPMPTSVRTGAYVEACRQIYAELPLHDSGTLGGFQRKILDAEDWDLSSMHHTQPTYHADWKPGVFADELVRLRQAHVASRGSLDARWKAPEEIDHPDRDEFIASGFRPIQEPTIRAAEIPATFTAARVARFDATELVPRQWFNTSVSDMADMHGELADKIPAYKDYGASRGPSGIETLRQHGKRMRVVDSEPHRPGYFDYVHRWSEAFFSDRRPMWRRWLLYWWKAPGYGRANGFNTVNVYKTMQNLRFPMHRGTFNARRLSALPAVDMKERLGNPDWLARVENLLWMGPAPWNWHWDEEDNLLIALNGEMWVILFDQNESRVLSNGIRMVGSVDGPHSIPKPLNRHWLDTNGSWLKQIPFYLIKLSPGIGVTVPSMTHHIVISGDSQRILMNAFFVPKFMTLQDVPTRQNGWFRKGYNNDTYLALRSLKQASIARMWESRKLGGFFMGTKLEVL